MERTDRIAEEIKKVISEMIQNELKDPRVKGLISITKVMLTKDLKFCKIYVSVMGADKEEVLQGIKPIIEDYKAQALIIPCTSLPFPFYW